jgi:sugar O-acyltransferase (sialic acid O-acetyltransferase NeuD family)
MSKKVIGLIAYGEFGIHIEQMLIQNGYDNFQFVYFDDIAVKNKVKNSFPFEFYTQSDFKDVNFIVCLGYKHLELKYKIVNDLKASGRKLLTFIHPSSFVNPTSTIGDGVIIYPKCNIDYKVKIGDACVLNNSCTISHETTIDHCSYLAASVITSGRVNIGEKVFIGSGTVISNNIKIEGNCIIGVGTVITKDVLKNSSVIGNPQKVLSKKINLK